MTTDRIDPYKAAPKAMAAMMEAERYIKDCGLESSLMELVKIRASQINGCAYCLDLHSKEAREQGETEKRLYVLCAWRESPLFSPRERAALAWTESLTLIADRRAPDALFDDIRQHFTDEELTNLTMRIGQINSLNRIAIGFGYRHP